MYPDTQIIQIVQPASSFGRSQRPRGDILGSTEQKIVEIWEEFLFKTAARQNITATTDFFAIGGTTPLLSHVLDRMRKAFRETLTITDLVHNATLRGMTTVAMNKTSIFTLGGASIDWKSETALPMTRGPDFSAEAVKTGQALVVLLTGATGFIGRAILECLASVEEVVLIHCVAIRSPAKTVPHPKIIYYNGDLTHHYLGLSDASWEQLSRSVDVVIHAAALADRIRPYASLRTTNVLPTKKLIQFAAPRLIPIHFISSAGVGRFVGHPTFPEVAVGSNLPPVHADGYTASKWASEAVLEKIHGKLDMPIMIHRPTTIIGPNTSSNDVLANLFQYAKELRAVPDLKHVKGFFDIIPLDVVARTISREALKPIQGINFSNIGGVKRVPVRDLHLAMAMDTGIEMKKVHLQEWVRMAKRAGMSQEIAHVFEEFDELVKVFVYPEVKRSRDLA
ncbi:uncharacterized protein K460DRAFT_274384 [Cucurbitaria berberidis CBS 394.84]|uniref:Thioester reductase (TE) domain-containing protein n=1 Tax=Cucurbitaria berberidis CBS 394.84 TaxID=1168544 RepID=A0A9P4GQT7_9PLEO|nr:uncharacterized protein K460DRAFT_274384 [Cucurbitaria berberidis CBS 394.84]KAF1849624.1 hypothetical protein K460DRAFT_274384 [Cucurbitaria berberidis CBS 394.84]